MALIDDNPRLRIGGKLATLARQLGQDFDQAADGIGVSRAQWRVIATVASREGVTQRFVADRLQISEVTAGRLIDRLCASGYLERRSNPENRRAYCIHLAPEAQPLLARLGVIASAQERAAFTSLGQAEIGVLEAALEVIAQNIARRREAGARRWAGGQGAVNDDVDRETAVG